ncbi:MAG: hypothetical protein WBW49_23020, partial [Candidatus Acidiferrum sp.]
MHNPRKSLAVALGAALFLLTGSVRLQAVPRPQDEPQGTDQSDSTAKAKTKKKKSGTTTDDTSANASTTKKSSSKKA